jgi:hypothetical protein
MLAHDARCMGTTKSEGLPMLRAHTFRSQSIQYKITCSLLPVCSLSNMTRSYLETTLDGSRTPHPNFSRACRQDWSSRIIKKRVSKRVIMLSSSRVSSPKSIRLVLAICIHSTCSFDNVWSLFPHTTPASKLVSSNANRCYTPRSETLPLIEFDTLTRLKVSACLVIWQFHRDHRVYTLTDLHKVYIRCLIVWLISTYLVSSTGPLDP